MIDIYSKFPIIEYQDHPAFSSINPGAVNYMPDLDVLQELEHNRKKLNKKKSFWSMLTGKKSDTENSKLEYRNFVNEYHNKLDIIKKEILGMRSDWSSFEVNSINELLNVIKNEVMMDTRALWWQNEAPQVPDIKDKKAFDYLENNGYTTFQLDRKNVAKLRSLIAPFEANIRKLDTRDASVRSIKVIDPTVYPEFIDYLQRCLRDLNVFSVASKYLKRDVFLEHTHLNVSRPQDEWWRARYHDLNLELPDCVGMHYDSSAGMMKVMLYLDDVDIDNGPFCYLPKTRAAYDQADFFRKLCGKASLYAGIDLDTPISRKLMLRLPSYFRNDSHFGYDLLRGSDLDSAYQSIEKKIVGGAGLVVLFDNYGLHRGGMTERGERVALQISLRAVDSYSLLS